MRIEKLSLSHKKILHDRLKSTHARLSQYSFANLYLFRNVHAYQVLAEGEDIFIGGKTYDGFQYVMPTVDIRTNPIDSWLALARDYDFIFPIPEEWLRTFESKNVQFEFSENDSDYVYTVEKLSTYKGHKLHGQKNLLNQFLSRYAPEAKPLTLDRMDDARDILETWQEDVGEDKNATDYDACREAFECYDALVLCGGIYYVENEPAGFVIGEEINPSMFALHFAKGKRKFKGLYQYMYNHFAKILPYQYKTLNFEEDLGKLALRIAKTSYDPDHVLKKYRIKIY